MQLDIAAARRALETEVAQQARPLGSRPQPPRSWRSRPRRWSARSRRSPSTRASTRATAVLIGGGGAAGLNAVAVARRLGCREVADPRGRRRPERRRRADVRPRRRVQQDDLRDQRALRCRRRSTRSWPSSRPSARRSSTARARAALEQRIDYTVEARYPHQIWEIEVPMRAGRFHERGGRARAGRRLPRHPQGRSSRSAIRIRKSSSWPGGRGSAAGCARVARGAWSRARRTPGSAAGAAVYFADGGWVEAAVRRFEEVGGDLAGPAIVESSFTTVVVDPGAVASRTAAGSLSITV